MKSFLLKLKRQYIINCVGSFYKDDDYELILKHLPKPYSFKREDEVLCNIFRVLALKQSNDDVWYDEFQHLMDNKMLEVFNVDTKNYLLNYLLKKLPEVSLLWDIETFDLSSVSKRVKKYFLNNRL